MSQKTCQEWEPARGSLRREAKEIGQMQGRRLDNDRKRILCDTLRIVSGRERRRWSGIVRRSRMAILW